MDCEVWMHTHSPRNVRVVIYRRQGELMLVVNDEEQKKTLLDLPLLSGLEATRA